jgi:4'-phosphopantetheinyl transferase
MLLSAYAQCDPTAVQLGKNNFGKPFLIPGDTGRAIRFNMSHSRDAVCYVLASDHEVGIDIEYIDSAFDWPSVSNAYFTEQERHQLESTQEEKRFTAFFTMWTRKEARLKAAGTGLGGLDENGRLKNEFVFENLFLQDFHYRNQYVGTVSLDYSLSAIRFFQYANA